MTEEEKKPEELQDENINATGGAATGTESKVEVDDDTYQKVLEGFKGSYDDELNELYEKIANREDFSYSVKDDTTYQQYADQYTQKGKKAMRDTMGQAASLTGGYSSSYAQQAGQQTYDSYLESLNQIIPTLKDQAYQKYKAEGDEMMTQYSMLNAKAEDEYGKYVDEYNRQQQAEQLEHDRKAEKYDQLLYLISTTGYDATEDELAAAGMTKETASSIKKAYLSSNPDLAYRSGQLTADEYRNMTGQWPAGYSEPSSGGGGGGYSSGGGGSGGDDYAYNRFTGKDDYADIVDVREQIEADYNAGVIDAETREQRVNDLYGW